ncbi:MAG TPA: ankyrin repeat domain-containing protein [Bryobacteraceae bacterium]
MRHPIQFAAALLLTAGFVYGQQTVCELWPNLDRSDGMLVRVTGELTISKDVAVLGSVSCERKHEVVAGRRSWSIGFRLRPSATAAADQVRQLDDAAAKADRLRNEGKLVRASGIFSGRLRLDPSHDFPAVLAFDSIESLSVEALPDPETLPVIPICELFQNLSAYKGKRIAVRGEGFRTMEGSWISGRCQGAFVTNGYRWPVSLWSAIPDYYSETTAPLVKPKADSRPPRGEKALRGRQSVMRTATYVGRLMMRDQYQARCRGSDYLTYGLGHLGSSAAELVVEAVLDPAVEPRVESAEPVEQEAYCHPPNQAARCAGVRTLDIAVYFDCADRAKEFLSKDGIDSRGDHESEALRDAVLNGNADLVKLLLDAGAPVNPATMQFWPPLWEAAHRQRIGIMKLLIDAHANLDFRDRDGETFIASEGFFSPPVLRVLLDAGAAPDARDKHGATALMYASMFGYETSTKLLLAHHADVKLKDDRGRTALMYAAEGKFIDAIPLLLAAGADPNAEDAMGHTALQIARLSNNQAAVEMLMAVN